MRKVFKVLDFGLLAIILAVALYGLYYFRFNILSQIFTALALGAAYVLWGVYHHLRERNLTGKIFLEYISIAALVVFILGVFLLRV